MTARPVRLGLRANAGQFVLLVVLNAFVGAMVGLERSVLPLIGEQDFDVRTTTAILSFVVAFGAVKAVTNLAAGALVERGGRKRLLVLGWLLALPIPVLIALAPSWGWIVAANLLLGANQGLAWSMTVNMKIDLVGPRRRGLALGLNESAGYLGVAATALITGTLAATYAPRTIVWVSATVIAVLATLISVFLVRDTTAHVAVEQQEHGSGSAGTLSAALVQGTFRDPRLRACSQAGLVNNLNDALAWGLAPLYLAANGTSVGRVGAVASVYPAVWGVGQIATGWLSDRTGRKPLIVLGMIVQAAALGLLLASGGEFALAFVAAALLGVGTALVYPTLIAAVSDAVQPVQRAQAVGVYRFWRDAGLVVGGVLAGVVADAYGARAAIGCVAALTGASGLWFLATRWPAAPTARRTVVDLLEQAQARIAPRLDPREALAAAKDGAILVDLRSSDERSQTGTIPGSIHIPRSVLEWRVDPESRYTNPHVGNIGRQIVLFCQDGFSSSFAAAALRDLGCERATDLVGGFTAWKNANLPVRTARGTAGDTLPGMGAPEPDQVDESHK